MNIEKILSLSNSKLLRCLSLIFGLLTPGILYFYVYERSFLISIDIWKLLLLCIGFTMPLFIVFLIYSTILSWLILKPKSNDKADNFVDNCIIGACLLTGFTIIITIMNNHGAEKSSTEFIELLCQYIICYYVLIFLAIFIKWLKSVFLKKKTKFATFIKRISALRRNKPQKENQVIKD